MLEYGHGITKNLEQAKKWYQKAIDLGHPSAKDALARVEKTIAIEEGKEAYHRDDYQEFARLDHRSPKVKNLLMRLEAAEQARDVDMAARVIEELRSLPGEQVADLDDKLAYRLGELNMTRLFEMKNGQWVSEITVKCDDSASRLAQAYGSTLASFEKLNGGHKPTVTIGEKVYVLNYPRFNLLIHRRSKTADLFLNGKFFKRYNLKSESGLKDGHYEWHDVSFVAADCKDLEMLLPNSTSVVVSEM